ncbi:response regulator transcription factor [Streptomyces sp. NPDC020707]|jgi:DNA-binding NarL/FixJ family response regulator|uniref:Helix-turn-helix transcriptional regulator n=1 Tax=Streptomyces ortus TaxID=2867268 RepID=A0ABT3VG28_9ACTN|nr:helix-turn-helix transcriptional regulator [Streptomyces ortus]MCX4238623.1 helix-turn-helix transcriptional regulator [Streptomyces ortus]
MTERPTADSPRPPLSRLDIDVLRLLAEGALIRHISGQLGLSPRTVHQRVQLLMTALGAADREELHARAKQQGLI